MSHPQGENFRVQFDRGVKVEFHGTKAFIKFVSRTLG